MELKPIPLKYASPRLGKALHGGFATCGTALRNANTDLESTEPDPTFASTDARAGA